jgi:hypothetical protein
MKIKGLRWKSGWEWTVVWDDGSTTNYYTNEIGEGLWVDGRQRLGTCQFSLTMSYNAAYSKIRRWLNQ